MQPHHETTLLIGRGAVWNSLDLAARKRMVRATELTVADDFIFLQQMLIYAGRQLHAQRPLNLAARGLLAEALAHLACFRRYALQTAECAAFFASVRPGQLGRRHRPRAAKTLCWLLRHEPRCLHMMAPLVECVGMVYSRQILRDRSDPRDGWRALHALRLRDETDHLSAWCRLLAACLAPLPWHARLRLGVCGGVACALLLRIIGGNRPGAWRLVWPRTPAWDTRLLRRAHLFVGRGSYGRIYVQALRQCHLRLRALLRL